MPDTPLRIPSAETLAAWHANEMTDEQLCEMEAFLAFMSQGAHALGPAFRLFDAELGLYVDNTRRRMLSRGLRWSRVPVVGNPNA